MPKFHPQTDVILPFIPIDSPAGKNRKSYNVLKLSREDKTTGEQKEYTYCSLNIKIIKPGEQEPVWIDVGAYPEYLRHNPCPNINTHENFILKKDYKYQCRESLNHNVKFNLTGKEILDGLNKERQLSKELKNEPDIDF